MYIINQIKYTLIVLLISLLALNGCQTEQYNEFDRVGEIIELEDGKLLVPITLELPVYSVIESKATTNETIVKNIRVLVYDSEGKVIQAVEGVIGSANNQIKAKLLRYNNVCSIQVFANIPDRLLESFQTGRSYAYINQLRLVTADLSNVIQNGIPITSEPKEFTKLDIATVNGYTASLKYACARIDITCNAPELSLSEVTLINAAKESEFGENKTSLDLGGVEMQNKIIVTNNKIENIYLFENSSIKPNSSEKNTTDLIVKINEGFYKICINHLSYMTDTIYSINRGNKYNVTIKLVKGPGYKTFQEAKANKPVNIDYNITIDDGRSKDIVTSNGSYYLGVTNSEFYLFADEAYGVTVTHLSHNAPATVTNATLSVSGTGITLRASEGYTVNTPTTATLNLKNGAVQNLPVKLDLTPTSTGGILTIRIGDLVKEIKITKKLNDTNSDRYTISSSNYTGSDFKNFTSLSDRLKISGKDLIMDNRPIYPDRNRVFAYATAFAGETRKNVLIAVKRPAQEVIYYEKYQDNTYGFSYQNGSCSSLDMNNEKDIIETGYGVVNLKSDPEAVISFEDDGTRFITYTKPRLAINNIFEDYYGGSLYGIAQDKNMNMTSFKSSKAHLVIFNNQRLNQYVFPFLAHGVYKSFDVEDGYSEGKPLIIRTADHFRTMHYVKILPEAQNNEEYYKQQHDIDFKNITFKGPIHSGENRNNFNGDFNKIKNLKFDNQSASYLSIFERNYGRLKNIHLLNCYSKNGGYSGVLTGINDGLIENIIVDSCYVQSYRDNAGYIAGINRKTNNEGVINNCLIIGDSRSTNSVLRNYYSNTGAVVGSNYEGSTISNICVIDINPEVPMVSIIHSNNYVDGLGGIVGNNTGSVSNSIFIGLYPHEEGNSYPITGAGGSNNAIKSYYTNIPSLSNDVVVGGGIAKSISGFEIGDLDPNHWICDKINGYPFPRLKKLPKETVPTSWPGKR